MSHDFNKSMSKCRLVEKVIKYVKPAKYMIEKTGKVKMMPIVQNDCIVYLVL